jgi:hypothetical protein
VIGSGRAGLLPEYIMDDIKVFLCQLEGMYRQFEGKVDRTNDGIIKAVSAVFEAGPSLEQVLHKLVDNAIFNKGDGKVRREPKPVVHGPLPVVADSQVLAPGIQASQAGPPESQAEALAPQAVPASQMAAPPAIAMVESREMNSWYIFTAQAVSKVNKAMQEEILGAKLMSYYIEWCSTDKQRVCGICYTDAVVRYNDAGGEEPIYNFIKERSPLNNIYVGVPFPLKDPVLSQAKERVMMAYSQTFWAIPEAKYVCLAARALANRGLNITEMFFLKGCGGVGLSLLTAHLAAQYGTDLHRYFDPNIFYADDELRKIVETFHGALILTGQERPTNSRLVNLLTVNFKRMDATEPAPDRETVVYI